MIGDDEMRMREDEDRNEAEAQGAMFEERVTDYLPTILKNGPELVETFRELAENEDVLLEWGEAVSDKLMAKAEQILLSAIQTELRLTAERAVEDDE